MGSYDTLCNNGDKVMGDNGNYERSPTVFGRAYRSAMSWRGRWPAGRGKIIGNGFWEKLPTKHTAEIERQIVDDFDEAQQRWVEEERMVIDESRMDHLVDGTPVVVQKIRDTETKLEEKISTKV